MKKSEATSALGGDVRLREIRSLAESIADEHSPAGAVDPQRILSAAGISCSYGAYGDYFDGMLEWDGVDFHVFCNLDRVERRDAPRAHFTLAHELGHYFIDEHRRALQSTSTGAHQSKCEFESKSAFEKEADEFAAALLMPNQRFERAAKRIARGLAGVLELARTFKTSIASTAIKYARSDLVPCAFIKWNPGGYAWKWLSNTTFQAKYRKTVESLEHVAPGSATRRALSGEAPPASGYFEAGTTAATWFPRVGQGEQRDVIMIEQAISLGRFGALTLLVPDGQAF